MYELYLLSCKHFQYYNLLINDNNIDLKLNKENKHFIPKLFMELTL